MMSYNYTKAKVFNRGVPSDSYLDESIAWCRTAPDEIFVPNKIFDIYSKVKPELGPYEDLIHRKAVMLEVQRVLAGFESSWDFEEGVDTSRLGPDTPENAEAGAWQVSYDSRHFSLDLSSLLVVNHIFTGVEFQQAMKFNHQLAFEYVARLMRYTTRHNGPLYKGVERLAIRKSQRSPIHSIYPWLSRESVKEFQSFL